MSLFELCEYIENGREIEFDYNNEQYFLAPLYLNDIFMGKYYIYSLKNKKNIFVGNLNEIITFNFDKNISLKTNIDLFVFKYIL